MNLRPVIFVIGVLVLAQIAFYAYAQKDNVQVIDQKLIQLDGKIREIKAEKSRLLNKSKELKKIIETIPPSLLMGFEDPETGFVEFLDYLQTPLLQKVDGKITLKDVQKFKQTPVPLHETGLNFVFGFVDTYNAEKFFNYLLLQEQYPLQVKSIKIDRSSGSKAMPRGNLSIALMIPARLQLPSTPEQMEVQ